MIKADFNRSILGRFYNRVPCVLLFLLASLLFSCTQPTGKKALQPWLNDVDIYVAGDFNDVATYWKNGEPVHLTVPDSFSHAAAICVSNGDVYVAGYKLINKDSLFKTKKNPDTSKETVVVDSANGHSNNNSSNGTIALYWKNGKAVTLSNGKNTAIATGIVVAGKDVYVSGYEYDGQPSAPGESDDKKSVAKYWKNGIPVILSDGYSEVQTTAIFVKDTDVYVVGFDKDSIGINRARYWKNGKQIPLKMDPHLFHPDLSQAFAVYVNGNDVYIAGQESAIATYWKNGKPVVVAKQSEMTRACNCEESLSSVANSIFISGADVYLAGTIDTNTSMYSELKLWKNGKMVSLTHAPETTKSDVLVTIYKNKVYVTGSVIIDESDSYLTKIWRNNIPVILSEGSIMATAISVVDRKPPDKK